MNLDSAIEKRTSTRRFTDYVVTDTELRQLLEAARRAPSWANTQSWEYIVVRDPELITRISATYSENNPATRCSQSASVLLAVCARKAVAGCKNGQALTRYNEWFMFDLGLSVQNLCLKACDLGLGTVIVGLLDHSAAAAILDLPQTHELAAIIPVGRPAVADKQGPPRKPLTEFVHLDRFGTTWD